MFDMLRKRNALDAAAAARATFARTTVEALLAALEKSTRYLAC